MNYVPVGEAARRLGVCEQTVRMWFAEGTLQGYRKPKGHRRISTRSIEELLSTQEATGPWAIAREIREDIYANR